MRRATLAFSFVGRGLVCAWALAPAVATAAQDTDTFQVTATVLESCEIEAQGDLEFGDYDPVSATPLTSAIDIEVHCTNGTGYDLGIDAGGGAGATVATRRMTRVGGGSTLAYSIYQDNTYTDVWGDTIGDDAVAGVGTGAVQTYTAYGRAPINQTALAGDYADTVTVRVEY